MSRFSSQTVKDMLTFTVSAINNTELSSSYLESVDYDALWKISRRQKMSALIAFAVCKNPDARTVIGEEIYEKWEKEKNRQIRKTILFDQERREILDHLEEMGIWYLPLKGSALQDFYPEYGMREMIDNDILYDVGHSEELISFMIERGYEYKLYREAVHDSFLKEPFYNFEFHRKLFPDTMEREAAYYSDLSRFLVKDTGNQYGYHFSNEELYIYLMAHSYKHYKSGGSGLRNLVDARLIRTQCNLDQEYISRQLRSLGIYEFEEKIRLSGDALFEKGTDLLQDDELKFLSELCEVSFYGALDEESIGRLLELASTEGTTAQKAKYLFRRVFPDKAWMNDNYPYTIDHPILIPAAYMIRALKGLVQRPVRIFTELFLVLKNKRQ